MPTDEDRALLVRRDRRALRLRLNRPKALNALDNDLIQDLTNALERVREDPGVHLIIVEAAGDRAFCAGGDIRSVREWTLAGDADRMDDFFLGEYTLNRIVARYPKPYVSLIDGVCMGGGMGIAVHGSARVVSERAVMAMPEVQIGFFPDVGASYFLPRLRGAFGIFLGLTGRRLQAGDACWLGLATHFVPRQSLPALADALAADGVGALADFARPPPPPDLAPFATEITDAFGRATLAEITAALASAEAAWAAEPLAAMRAASPASLRAALALLQAGAGRSLEQALYAELLQSRLTLRHPDFVEGVRAMVIDKDRKPVWAASED